VRQRVTKRLARRAAAATNRSIDGDPTKVDLILLALSTYLVRAGFARACFPKTVSSTRRQYASMTFAFSTDSPLVTRISGPNPESVAVRLTIM
jgi:hypothetical protein